MRYAVEAKDRATAEKRVLDSIAVNKPFDEFSQAHLHEHLIHSSGPVSDEEYEHVFDNDNSYIKHWSLEEKKRYIVT